MNVISYNLNSNNKVVYCCVDDTNAYKSAWTKEVIKNLAEFTIGNLVGKEYSVLQGLNERELLVEAANKNFEYAVVFSTGTEFINGDEFFNEVNNLITNDFFIAGHILDRGDAYYELHRQCYIVNLNLYKQLNFPTIGEQELGKEHTQISPIKSAENYHDNYTPIWVKQGTEFKKYNHTGHGWHILKLAFEKNLPVIVFDDKIRRNKKHHYPEVQLVFLESMQWAYYRYNFCLQDFIHNENSEFLLIKDCQFEQVVTPASGIKFTNFISKTKPVSVIFYDYNQETLDNRKKNLPSLPNVTYKFIRLDLLGLEFSLNDIVDTNIENTLINMSNIFCYEGTAMLTPLEYRIFKENMFLSKLKENMPLSYVYFSTRAASGFKTQMLQGLAKDLEITTMDALKKPTWRFNGEWN